MEQLVNVAVIQGPDGEREPRQRRKPAPSLLDADHRKSRSNAAIPAVPADGFTVGSVKWDMLRRLQDEKALLYSLQDRQLAKIQAALRNNSKANVNAAQADRNAGFRQTPTLPWFAIDSRGLFKQRWDVLLSVVIVYSVFMLPLRLGFEFEATGVSFYLEYVVVDLLFAVDMVLSVMSRHVSRSTGRVEATDDAIRTYLSRWFFVDLLSTLPLDQIVLWLLSNAQSHSAVRSLALMRILRLTRLFKFLRLMRLSRIRSRYQGMRLVWAVVCMLFAAHVIACGWSGLLVYQSGPDLQPGVIGQHTWWDTAVVAGFAAHGESVPTGLRYLISFYWTITTMMGVGYGDIHAVTPMERLYSVVVMLVGAASIGILLSTITTLLRSLNAYSHALAVRLHEVKLYMRDRKLPKPLQHRILDYYSNYYKKKTLFNEGEILSSLSLPLRNEIVEQAHRKVVDGLKLFQSIGSAVRSALLHHLRPVHHMPGDVVGNEGTLGKELVFVVGGTLDVSAFICPAMVLGEVSFAEAQSSGVLRTIGVHMAGTHFGLVSTLLELKQPCTYTCSTICDLQVISKQDLDVVLFDFPDVRVTLTKDAQRYLKAVQVVKSSQAEHLSSSADSNSPSLSPHHGFTDSGYGVNSSKPVADTKRSCWRRRFSRISCGCCRRLLPKACTKSSKSSGSRSKVHPMYSTYSTGTSARSAASEFRRFEKQGLTTMMKMRMASKRYLKAAVTKSRRKLASSASQDDRRPSTDIPSLVVTADCEPDLDSNPDYVEPLTPPLGPGIMQLVNGEAVTAQGNLFNSTKGFDTERVFRTIRLGPRVIDGPWWSCAWIGVREFVTRTFVTRPSDPPKPGEIVGLWRVVDDVETAATLRRRLTLLPDDPLKVAIDVVMLLLVLVTVVEVPLVLAYEIADTTTSTIFDAVVDACFAFDMVTNFRMAVEDCDRNMYTLPTMMANAYVKGAFKLDFLSTFPFDRVFVSTVGMGVSLRSLKLLRFLRLFRLLKLFRFLKLRHYLHRIQRAMVSSPHFLQLIKLVVQVAVVSHVIGCSFYWLSSLDTISSAKHWYTADPTLGTSKSDYYVASVYWAMTTMTTVGYGDVVPVTPIEVMFVVFAMVLGAVVYGVVASIVGVAVGEIGAPSLRISGKMQEVVDYLHVRKVPPDLFQRTCTQYEYYLSRKSAFEEDVILSELTESLRQEVVFHLNADVIRSVPYFVNKDPDFVLQIVSLLKPLYATPSEFLYLQGEPAWEMFFLVKGVVELVADVGSVGEDVCAVMTEGSYFGELALLLSVRRSTAARVLEHSNLFVLNKEAIQQTVLSYPSIVQQLEEALHRSMNTVKGVRSFTEIYLAKRKRASAQVGGSPLIVEKVGAVESGSELKEATSHPNLSRAARLALRSAESSFSLQGDDQGALPQPKSDTSLVTEVSLEASATPTENLDVEFLPADVSDSVLNSEHALVQTVSKSEDFSVVSEAIATICNSLTDARSRLGSGKTREEDMAVTTESSQLVSAEMGTTAPKQAERVVGDSLVVFDALEASILSQLRVLAAVAAKMKLDGGSGSGAEEMSRLLGAYQTTAGAVGHSAASSLPFPRKPRKSGVFSQIDGEALSDRAAGPSSGGNSFALMRIAMQLKRKSAERRQQASKPIRR